MSLKDANISLEFIVLPEHAQAAAQLVLFPRSWGGFKNLAEFLPMFKKMGYEAIRFPPVHPSAEQIAEGKNNSDIARPDDVGCPYAIGDSQTAKNRVRRFTQAFW